MTAEQPDRTDLIFKALASKPRRQILAILATGGGADDARCCTAEEVCACVFAEKLNLGAPTVSHHMKALLDAGLVSASKRGLWVYYRLEPGALASIVEEFASLTKAEAAGSASGCCTPAAENKAAAL